MRRACCSDRIGVLAALVISWFAVAAPPALAASDDGVWITLGADAFETLTAGSPVLFHGHPLEAADRADGVVATRVEAKDLERISARLHDAFERCAGFMAHGSRAEAEAVLARLRAPAEVEGTPPVYAVDHPAEVQAMLGELDANQILGTIHSLSTTFNNRYYNHPSGANAATWIRNLWLAYAAGRPDVTVELFDHPSFAQPSVVMTIPGTTLPDQVVILGGHLDSIASGSSNPDFSAPGADDNASGIATVTEVARAMLALGLEPQRTVKFMGYAAEEVGLRGSQEIASAYATDGVDVFSVLQLDMTAFQGSTEDVSVITDFTSAPLNTFLEEILDTYLPDLSWSTSACGYACSDHGAWTFQGYPAAFTFEARFGQHNHQIHSTGDTVTTFGDTAAHAFKFVRLAAAYVAEAAYDGLNPLFADGFETGSTSAWTLTFEE
ncbi:MAG: M20/M25/M40 family metallo-hydrolase [Acidobacteria bacterium]|nr:M20/M25/M40 family metallo-hydrolase [Acidobacteriota bacterium]